MDKAWGESSSVDQEAQTLLSHLKEIEIQEKLPKDNIKNVILQLLRFSTSV